MKRRRFLKSAATVAVGFQIVPRHVLGQGQTPPSAKLNIAGVGIGGQRAAAFLIAAATDLPSGAVIVLVSSALLGAAALIGRLSRR